MAFVLFPIMNTLNRSGSKVLADCPTGEDIEIKINGEKSKNNNNNNNGNSNNTDNKHNTTTVKVNLAEYCSPCISSQSECEPLSNDDFYNNNTKGNKDIYNNNRNDENNDEGNCTETIQTSNYNINQPFYQLENE